MPNNVQNELTITGETTEKVFEFLKGKKKFIDFNAIVPMPESLRGEFHSGITTAVEYALKLSTSNNVLLRDLQATNRRHSKSALELKDEEWNKFIICLNNVRKYGHVSWYEWSIANWGTKWNAYEQERIENILRFETAWSNIAKLIKMVSEKYPKATFDYRWADEDTGNNTGHIIFNAGESKINIPENNSKESYDLRFSLCPSDREYYALKGGKYEYVGD